MRLLFLFTGAACQSIDLEGGDDSAGGDDGAGDDSAPPEITYPSGDRILLYWGHGGAPGNSIGQGEVTQVDERWKDAFGWNTDWRDYLPDTLEDYRMVGLMAPGMTEEEPFSDDDAALFAAGLDGGTRLAVFGDATTCGRSAVNDLLGKLGATIRWNGDGADANRVLYSNGINSQHQATQGVASLRFRDPCYCDQAEGEALVTSEDRDVMACAERPGTGGDVILVGDFEWFDDSGGLGEEDNAVFADNLVIVEP